VCVCVCVCGVDDSQARAATWVAATAATAQGTTVPGEAARKNGAKNPRGRLFKLAPTESEPSQKRVRSGARPLPLFASSSPCLLCVPPEGHPRRRNHGYARRPARWIARQGHGARMGTRAGNPHRGDGPRLRVRCGGQALLGDGDGAADGRGGRGPAGSVRIGTPAAAMNRGPCR